MEWLSESALPWVFRNWRDIVTVIGLAASTASLIFAILAMMAAKSAQQAAEAARASLGRNSTIDDLARASQSIQRIKDLHIDGEWRRALDRYYDIRVMLSDIRTRHPNLDPGQMSTIQVSIHQLETIEANVENAFRNQVEPSDVQRYNAVLTRTQTVLEQISSDLKQSL